MAINFLQSKHMSTTNQRLLKDLDFSELISLRDYLQKLKDNVYDPQGVPRINNFEQAEELKNFPFKEEITYLDRYITGKYIHIKNLSTVKQS